MFKYPQYNQLYMTALNNTIYVIIGLPSTQSVIYDFSKQYIYQLCTTYLNNSIYFITPAIQSVICDLSKQYFIC